MCPDALNPDNSQPNRNFGNHPSADFSQFAANLPEGSKRIICSRDMYQPFRISLPAENPGLIAAALEACGHEIGASAVKYLIDSIRLATPISGDDLLELGLAPAHIHVGETREIGAEPEQKPTLTRELYIVFLEPPDSMSEFEDTEEPERLLNEAKLVFSPDSERPGKILCELKFDVGDYDQDTVDLRWEIASRFAGVFADKELPDRMPVVIPPGLDDGQPIFYHGSLSLDLEILDPEHNGDMKVVEKLNLQDTDDDEPGDFEASVHGDFDPVTGEFVPERPLEDPEAYEADKGENRKLDLESFWKGAIVPNLTAEELFGIMSATGFAEVSLDACRSLINGVVVNAPIGLREFGFLGDSAPAGVQQEIDYWLDASTNTYAGTTSVKVEMDDESACAGFRLVITTLARDSEQRATTESILSWDHPDQISATGKWRIVSLATKSNKPVANRG